MSRQVAIKAESAKTEAGMRDRGQVVVVMEQREEGMLTTSVYLFERKRGSIPDRADDRAA